MTKTIEQEKAIPDTGRRNFLRSMVGVAGVATVTAVPIAKKSTPPQSIPLTTIQPRSAPALEADPDADVLIRMQADLARALQKPMIERRWIMVIDLRKCVGCHACTIACVAENKLPPGVVYPQVVEQEIGAYPNVTRRFMPPRPCLHCNELLTIQPVTLTTPVQQIVSRNGVRVNCVACGEEIINEREVVREGRPYCAACAGPAYYAPDTSLVFPLENSPFILHNS